MVDKLRINAIYNDFINTVTLTKEQKLILDMLLERESYIRIGDKIGVSERTVGYEVQKLKRLFNDYCNMQLSKIIVLLG